MKRINKILVVLLLGVTLVVPSLVVSNKNIYAENVPPQQDYLFVLKNNSGSVTHVDLGNIIKYIDIWIKPFTNVMALDVVSDVVVELLVSSDNGIIYMSSQTPSINIEIDMSTGVLYDDENFNELWVFPDLTISNMDEMDLKIYQTAYGRGYNNGFSEGYAEGLVTGSDEYINGFHEGLNYSFNNGYNSFIDQYGIPFINSQSYTYQLGYESGLDSMRDFGDQKYQEGYNDGVGQAYENGFGGMTWDGNPIDDKNSYSYGLGINSSQQDAYNKGYLDGGKNSFMGSFDKWIVPAIIIVIVVGGAFSIMAMKRRGD